MIQQPRLEEEPKQTEAEQARREQEERERKAAEGTTHQEKIERHHIAAERARLEEERFASARPDFAGRCYWL